MAESFHRLIALYKHRFPDAMAAIEQTVQEQEELGTFSPPDQATPPKTFTQIETLAREAYFAFGRDLPPHILIRVVDECMKGNLTRAQEGLQPLRRAHEFYQDTARQYREPLMRVISPLARQRPKDRHQPAISPLTVGNIRQNPPENLLVFQTVTLERARAAKIIFNNSKG